MPTTLRAAGPGTNASAESSAPATSGKPVNDGAPVKPGSHAAPTLRERALASVRKNDRWIGLAVQTRSSR
jgi:hypothetical protein